MSQALRPTAASRGLFQEEGLALLNSSACIYIVATPIGNLEDLSLRAKAILAQVDLIAAEDTRHTAKLLSLLGIKGKELISYHDHIEEQRARELVVRAQEEGLQIAVVSDAGTPCIADPGYRIVAEARRVGVKVIPIPGPSALTCLASAAGLPTDRLLFIGFLPVKPSALTKEISSWQASRASIICYESARRLLKTLQILADILPSARLAIAREMTKLFEEIVLVTPAQALDWARNHQTLKGELTLMIAPGNPPEPDADSLKREISVLAAKALVEEGASQRDLMERFRDCGLDRKQLYELLLALRE